MEEIKTLQKKYCSQALIAAIVVALLCILAGEKPIGKGILLGTLFSIINFIIMGLMIPMRLAKSRYKASGLAFLSIFLRFAILAVPLIISIKIDAVGFFGVVVGLFTVQLAMLFNHLILNRLSFTRKA